MPNLLETLTHFETILNQAAPTIATRLQPGLSLSEIEAQTAGFSWKFPSEAYGLYQWHNGLSSKPGKLSLAEKLLRLKGKWHGELSGRENEIHLKLNPSRRMIAKFLPLDYTLSGHRHLKLGRCLIDLLPIAILNDSDTTIYCMMRLDAENPIVYCANGTKLPPMKVTEAFLSTQPQFRNLNDAIAVLAQWFLSETNQKSSINEDDAQLDLGKLAQIYQQHCKSNEPFIL
ncbi:hypothetical protein [Leptolyngbya sp. NIES-2104]|uniref:hypothetical protein n=1 Tax=Leptolyngbya sp. NIES-2104 TaxID=1552121 RepID=UPI0006EC8B3A|nr:hypothetical protein [Leptolyngbya sp. NIES-2104]GAP99770.1 hypothetical protein NIES2104_63360 [Leptolyngbya sp. NIES-2104]